MSTYRDFEMALNHPKKRWLRRFLIVAGVVVVIALAAGVKFISGNMGIEEVRNQPIISSTLDSTAGSQKIDEPYFKMVLPGKWKEIFRSSDKGRQTIEWQSTQIHYDARYLTIYIDNTPQDFGFNRLVPLNVVGDALHPGPLSDNCITFTNKDDPISTSGYRKATWQDVSFLCDAARTVRNLVGTGTPSSGIATSVTGPTSQTHVYFFTYADNTSQVDLSTFGKILATFQAK